MPPFILKLLLTAGPLLLMLVLSKFSNIPPTLAWGLPLALALVLAIIPAGWRALKSADAYSSDSGEKRPLEPAPDDAGFSAPQTAVLLGRLPWGFLTVDGNGRIRAANALARALLALPPEAERLEQSVYLVGAVGGEHILKPKAETWQAMELYLPSGKEGGASKTSRELQGSSHQFDPAETVGAAGRPLGIGSGPCPARPELSRLFFFTMFNWPVPGGRAIFVLPEAVVRDAHGDVAPALPGALSPEAAHRLNNDLAAILGYIELTRSELSPGGLEYVGYYLDSTVKAVAKARDLIRRGLPGEADGPSKAEPVLLAELADESVRLLRVNQPDNLKLDPVIAAVPANEQLPPVMADPARLHQALMLIYRDLARALGQGGGRLTVAISRPEAGPERDEHIQGGTGREARETFQILSLAAKGDFPPLTREHILTALLAQSQDTRKMLSRPAGLKPQPAEAGLLRFDFHLPETEARSAALPAHDAPETGGGKKILFVDDELSLADIGQKTLTRLGHQVTTVTDSQKALDLLRANAGDYELLITDQTMPGLTGLELAAAAARIRPDLPVLLFTGFVSPQLFEKARHLGIRQVLLKPLNQQELAEAIRRL